MDFLFKSLILLNLGISYTVFANELTNQSTHKIETSLIKPKQEKILRYGKLMVRFSSGSGIYGITSDRSYLPINEDAKPVSFETDFFIGRCVIRIKDAVGASETAYFNGKSRKFSIQIEGRFKKKISSNQVLFGATFSRKLRLPYFSNMILSFMSKVDPSLRYSLNSDAPWVMSPLISGAERMSVRETKPQGVEPWVYGGDKRIEDREDTYTLIAEKVERTTWNYIKRRKYFSKEKNRVKTFFEPRNLYSFDFLSSRIDWNTFKATFGMIDKKIIPYLNGQPFKLEARVMNEKGEVQGILWSFDFIHDDLLKK